MPTAIITLTTAGTGTGSFSLYTNMNYSTPFETFVDKSLLLAGYETTIPDVGATIIRVKSTGTCTNYVDIPITPLTAYQYIVTGPNNLLGNGTYVEYYGRYREFKAITAEYGDVLNICASSIISVTADTGGGISGPGVQCYY